MLRVIVKMSGIRVGNGIGNVSEDVLIHSSVRPALLMSE